MATKNVEEACQRMAAAAMCFGQAEGMAHRTGLGIHGVSGLERDLRTAWNEAWAGIGNLRDAFTALGMIAPGDDKEPTP